MKKQRVEHVLYLGSQSPSRQQLLREARIPFTLVDQDADERSCDWGLPAEQLVLHIARKKMERVVLPAGTDGQTCFVLTADTLTHDKQGRVYGKPENREQAKHNVKLFRDGCTVGTAFCLEKRTWRDDAWQPVERIEKYVAAQCVIAIPDELIDHYFDTMPGALHASGGIMVDSFGAQFVKQMSGSYTTILGLPMFELREALATLHFFD